MGTQRCVRCFFSIDCATRDDGLNDCDPTGTCVAFRPCNALNPNPGTDLGQDHCRYGQFCANGTCAAVPPDYSCWGALHVEWNWRDHGPVIVTATAMVSSDPIPQCAPGSPNIIATLDFYAPAGFTYDNPNDQLSAVTMVTFTNPAPNGGQRQADFVLDAPASGAFSGRLRAGVCNVPAYTGWGVTLRDSPRGHTGNIVCLH
jgi:hypothetical protein